MKKTVILYTDGACSGNPGPGGWAFLLQYGTTSKEQSGHVPQTTNNRMEMTAAIQGLCALTESCRVELYTDSKYVLEGATKWLADWKARGWRKSDKKPILNLDLWQELSPLLEKHTIHWHWVKGHAGHFENERVDFLARTASQK